MKEEKLFQEIEQLKQEIADLKASRGVRAFFRRAFSKSSFIAGVSLAAILTGFLAWAAQITFVDGTIISAADVNANFTELFGKVNCRSNFWSLGDGRTCMDSTLRGPASYYAAVDVCRALAPGSRVCTESDYIQACGAGYAPLSSPGPMWVGNIQADDYYYITNVMTCASNFLGSPAPAFGGNYFYRCCY